MLWRRRWVIGGTMLLVTSIAVLVAFEITPRYTATAEVLVDPRERNVADVEAVLSGLSSDVSTIDSQIQVIRSRSLAARVIQQLGLQDDPEFNSRLRKPGVAEEILNSVRRLVFSSRSGESAEERLERERSEVIDHYLESLSVFQVGRRSFVIGISFTSDDPHRASEVANTVSELYLVEQLEAKFEATQRATEWLDERLGALRETLRASEEQVEAYRTEQGLIDSAGLSIDEQQLSEINAQLILARAHLAEKRARFRQLNELVTTGAEVESLAEVLASDEIANLRGGQAELAREQADLMSRYGDRHPMMIKVRAQLKDLNLQIASEVKRIVANLENEVAVARSRTISLQNSLDTLQGRRSSEQVARIRLRALQREAQANRALYESFLGRFKETSEQVGTAEADGHIISSAT
ncbi:MAG: GumC family protein, partial [bacterium]|nr:GumC family protein [bacterium]